MSIQIAAGAAAAAFGRREEPGRALADQAGAVARACHAMAERFHGGGKLLVFGNGGASTDAQHVAVEFLHPVVVGKRALPALALTNDVASITGLGRTRGFDEVYAGQLAVLGVPGDIALGISPDGDCTNVLRGLAEGRARGLLTIALAGGDGGRIAAAGVVDHLLLAPSAEPAVVKELQVTTYHILWELVHVFFEQPGLLGPEVIG